MNTLSLDDCCKMVDIFVNPLRMFAVRSYSLCLRNIFHKYFVRATRPLKMHGVHPYSEK